MFRGLKVWVKTWLKVYNFAKSVYVHKIFGMESDNLKEFWESGFLELAFFLRFTGNMCDLARAPDLHSDKYLSEDAATIIPIE